MIVLNRDITLQVLVVLQVTVMKGVREFSKF